MPSWTSWNKKMFACWGVHSLHRIGESYRRVTLERWFRLHCSRRIDELNQKVSGQLWCCVVLFIERTIAPVIQAESTFDRSQLPNTTLNHLKTNANWRKTRNFTWILKSHVTPQIRGLNDLGGLGPLCKKTFLGLNGISRSTARWSCRDLLASKWTGTKLLSWPLKQNSLI